MCIMTGGVADIFMGLLYFDLLILKMFFEYVLSFVEDPLLVSLKLIQSFLHAVWMSHLHG